MEQWKIAAEIYNQVLLKLSDISYAGVEIKVVVNEKVMSLCENGILIIFRYRLKGFFAQLIF